MTDLPLGVFGIMSASIAYNVIDFAGAGLSLRRFGKNKQGGCGDRNYLLLGFAPCAYSGILARSELPQFLQQTQLS